MIDFADYLATVFEGSVDILAIQNESSTIVNTTLQFFNCLAKKTHVFCFNGGIMLVLYEVIN